MEKEPSNIKEIATYSGRLERKIASMTMAEKEAYYKAMAIRTREYLFSIGQPLVHKKDGKIVAEYADGSVKTIH